jgi:hypothetical protein
MKENAKANLYVGNLRLIRSFSWQFKSDKTPDVCFASAVTSGFTL